MDNPALTYREVMALLANRAGQASRLPGAPSLSAESTVDALVAWFAWNDPNGLWYDCGADTDMYRREEAVERCEECVACRPLTVDDAWEVLGEMLRDEYRAYRREANVAQSSRVVLETAREALAASGDHAGADAISAMLDQCGCEDFDPAVTDGRLTTLMDVIIHG